MIARRLAVVLGVASLFALFEGGASAQGRADRAVATIGGRTALTVGEVERRLAQVPKFQLRTLGNSEDAIKRAFVNELLNLELMAVAARDEKLHELPDIAESIRLKLRDALEADIRREVEATKISDEDIKAYYDAHREQYRAQQRIKLSRIVVASQQDAQKLLDTIANDPEYQKDPGAGWDKLAREHSLDKGTAMRGGDLGFVQPDGSTAHKDVRVNPVLFAKAATVRDGEVVPEPIADGSYWVVLQRRGSLMTPERTLEMEKEQIRRTLAHKTGRGRALALLESLRKKYVSQLNDQLIAQVEVTRFGDLTPQQRPGGLPRVEHPAAGSPVPEGQPGNLR